MIISRTRQRFLCDERATHRHDQHFLLNAFNRQLKEKYSHLFDVIKMTDQDWDNVLMASEFQSVEPTGHQSPNTKATFTLPNKTKLRGPFSLLYNRVSITDYFGVLTDENDKDTLQAEISYQDWVESYKRGELAKLIHHEITYKLGRTFMLEGGIYQTDKSESHVGKPLGLYIPTMEMIEKGWLKLRHISETKAKGSLTHQTLDVRLRLVSTNHLFIEDEEVIIKLKLTRPLRHYHTHHEEVEHVD